MPETPKKFYLTTPIYYVNARPHIGHAYSTIAADVVARRHRLLGDDTFFLTGTDEHGQKVQRSAEAAGIPPQQFADEVSASFSNLWKRMGILDDSLSKDDPLLHRDFIRTTDARHRCGVQKLWRTLEERGAIYLSSYTGQYCVSEEMFVDVPVGAPCPTCGRITETITEENYFFRLSNYQKQIIDLIESNQLHIQPEAIRNEVLSFLRGGLKDLSISRTSFTWGIPVPGNPKHVVYVWLDALANYMTAIGYGAEDRDDLTPEQKQAELEKFARYWPADLHLVGKEITRFHCVYWPAFLLAAGLPLPKAVVANGWLLFEESKMSKSRGNVVRTETILDAFGEEVYAKQFPDSSKAERDLFASDVLRYFLLREIPFGQDGTFSFDALITRYNADLANGYGNLVSRTLTMVDKYCEAKIPHSAYGHIGIVEFISGIDRVDGTEGGAIEFQRKLNVALKSCNFSTVLELVQEFVKRVDLFLSDKKPWKLDASVPEQRIERDHVLYNAADAVKNITFLLYPFMPFTASQVWEQLGFETPIEDTNWLPEMVNLWNLKWGGLKPGTKLGPLAPIFPRADKGLAQIMSDMESNNSPNVAKPHSSAATASTMPESVKSVKSVAASSPVAATAADAAGHTSETITIDDFAKVDLRVAQIVVAERIPKADKLLRLEVDLGPGFNPSRRQILAGIAEYYAPEALIGRKVVIVANLAPRKMRGLESQGMIVAASLEDHGRPSLAGFLDDVELGARLR